MRASRISYAFLGSFLITIFCLNWWAQASYPVWVWVVLGLFGIFFGFLTAYRRHALGLAIVVGISLAIISVSFTTHVPSSQTVDFYADDVELGIRGWIAEDPDRRELTTKYVVEADLLKRTPGPLHHVRGQVLVSVRAGNPPLEYGDEVIVQGKLERPGQIEDFAYDRYLSRYDIYATMNNVTVEKIGDDRGHTIFRSLYRFRALIEGRIEALLTEPHASLLAGLLLGTRSGMSKDLAEDFKTTGLTHLVAISGYNITVLITVMGTLLFWLPLKWRFLPSVILIAAFTLITGASASAVRAAVMGILGLLALQLGRVQTIRLTVLWTAFFMIAWNPKVLWIDVGFHLSFLALLGVMEIPPLLKPWLERLPEWFGIRDMLCLTIAAQMTASPWILYLFGQLSLIAPVSNLLAPPVVPFAMLFGVLSLLASVVSGFIGQLLAAFAWLPLQWMVMTAEILGAIPFAAVTMKGLGTFWIILYYGLLIVWVLKHDYTLRLATLAQSESLSRFTIHNAKSSSSRSTAEASPLSSAFGAGIGTHAI